MRYAIVFSAVFSVCIPSAFAGNFCCKADSCIGVEDANRQIEACTTLLRNDPHDARLLYVLGRAHLQKGDYDMAITYCTEASSRHKKLLFLNQIQSEELKWARETAEEHLSKLEKQQQVSNPAQASSQPIDAPASRANAKVNSPSATLMLRPKPLLPM